MRWTGCGRQRATTAGARQADRTIQARSSAARAAPLAQSVWDVVVPSLYCLVADRTRVVDRDIPLSACMSSQSECATAGAGACLSAAAFVRLTSQLQSGPLPNNIASLAGAGEADIETAASASLPPATAASVLSSASSTRSSASVPFVCPPSSGLPLAAVEAGAVVGSFNSEPDASGRVALPISLYRAVPSMPWAFEVLVQPTCTLAKLKAEVGRQWPTQWPEGKLTLLRMRRDDEHTEKELAAEQDQQQLVDLHIHVLTRQYSLQAKVEPTAPPLTADSWLTVRVETRRAVEVSTFHVADTEAVWQLQERLQSGEGNGKWKCIARACHTHVSA